MKEISDELYNKLSYLGIIDDTGVREHNGGNSDYSKQILQPWSIWLAFPNLTSWDHDIIKRVLRTKKGDPRELDYKKIIHDCQERLRQLSYEQHG